MFGNKLLKNEILSTNWSHGSLSYKLFKYVAPFFLFKDLAYGGYADKYLQLLKNYGLGIIFITDTNLHEKALNIFKSFNLFSIALVSTNLNP